MSTTRNVTCYATNKTTQQFDFTSDNIQDGEYASGGNPQTILAGDTSKLIFSAQHSGGMMNDHTGATGMIFYNLGDGFTLQLSYNCPYNEFVGMQGYSTTVCYFYAGITCPPGTTSAPSYMVTCDVTMNNQPWDPTFIGEVNEGITSVGATITIESIYE